MSKFNKKFLFTTAAVVALSAGVASTDAKAFDEVNWNWNKEVLELVTKTVNINIENLPSGMVEIEKVQTQIGDVTADSTISGISNNPPGVNENGTVSFSEVVTVTSNFDKPVGVGNSVPNSGGGVSDDGDTPLVSTYLGGTLSEQQNGYTVINDVQIDGELELSSLQGINDAVDLPKVESSATAVGNNQTIDSSVSLDLHDGQFIYGGYAAGDQTDNSQLLSEVLSVTPELGNTNTSGAAFLTFAGALGLIEPAQVSANSNVSDILNAFVESSSTAVGNNIDIAVNAVTADDAMVLADVTQYAYADVTAVSSVTDVAVNGYTNFGAVNMGPLGDTQIPLVSSSATAVGNNFAIRVSSPDL